MADQMDFCAEGFRFLNEADAKLAMKEKKQVEYLQQRLRSDKPAEIKSFYIKAINENIFKSPIGMEYLYQLYTYMIGQGIATKEELEPIPINHPCEKLVKPRKNVEEEKDKIKYHKSYLMASLFINFLLVCAVLFMFYVAMSSSNPNILNYEKAITNQYAAWDEELTKREKEVKKREKALKEATESNIESTENPEDLTKEE